jgi:hypothetical protein
MMNLRRRGRAINPVLYAEAQIITDSYNYFIFGLIDGAGRTWSGFSYDANTNSVFVNGTGTQYTSAYAGTTALINNTGMAGILQLAWDKPGGKLWVGRGGTYLGGGNPVTGATPTISGLSPSTAQFLFLSTISSGGNLNSINLIPSSTNFKPANGTEWGGTLDSGNASANGTLSGNNWQTRSGSWEAVRGTVSH